MQTIYVDYYLSAYGKTLLIQSNGIENLIALKDVFSKLAYNQLDQFSLSDIQNIKLTNISDVVFTNKSTYVYAKEKNNVIRWEQPETDWYNCEGLIEGLIEGAKVNQGGHQYFTPEDGIIVVISENENLKQKA